MPKNSGYCFNIIPRAFTATKKAKEKLTKKLKKPIPSTPKKTVSK